MGIIKSKKFQAFLVTVALDGLIFLAAQGMIDPEWAKFLAGMVTLTGVTFIGAQGIADHGKEKAKEEKR